MGHGDKEEGEMGVCVQLEKKAVFGNAMTYLRPNELKTCMEMDEVK